MRCEALETRPNRCFYGTWEEVTLLLSDRSGSMRFGEIVEMGPTRDIFLNPRHDYTRQLFAAIPGSARRQ